MPILVSWDNPDQTVIRCEISGRWTWEEFEEQTSRARNMVSTTPHQKAVGYLVIIENVSSFPYNVMGISRKYLQTRSPRMKIVMVVSSNPFARALYKAVAKMTPSFSSIVEMAATEEQGRILINQRLATIGERIENN